MKVHAGEGRRIDAPPTAWSDFGILWVSDQAAVGKDGLRAYVYVANVDDTLAAVTAHGGQVVAPPYPEGTLRVALFSDPAGNVFGVWRETAGRPLADGPASRRQ
jgi:predicted enzyme related to lactoylglutathione lyase